MELYKELYFQLFAAIADAVEALEHGEPIAARRLLIAAQRKAKEKVLEAEEDTEE